MSTRSIIAVPDRQRGGWKGTYHHSDGYPTGLGIYLSRILDALGWKVGIARKLIVDDHPGGWSCLFPTYLRSHVFGGPCTDVEECALVHGKAPSCYCHDQEHPEVQTDDQGPAYFFGDEGPVYDTDAEWFYLLTPDGIEVRQIIRVGRRTWRSELGPQQSLRGACAEQLVARGKDPDEFFRAKDDWAFKVALPPFILGLKVTA